MKKLVEELRLELLGEVNDRREWARSTQKFLKTQRKPARTTGVRTGSVDMRKVNGGIPGRDVSRPLMRKVRSISSIIGRIG